MPSPSLPGRLRVRPGRFTGVPAIASRKGCSVVWSQSLGVLPLTNCTGITRRGCSSRTTSAASAPVYTLAPPPTPMISTSGRPNITLSAGLSRAAVPPRWAMSRPPCFQRHRVDWPKRRPPTRSWGPAMPSIERPLTLKEPGSTSILPLATGAPSSSSRLLARITVALTRGSASPAAQATALNGLTSTLAPPPLIKRALWP